MIKTTLFSIVFLFAAGTAFGQTTQVPTPRTIDMTTPIFDENGKPVIDPSNRAADDPKCEKCSPLTLGTLVAHALTAQFEDEKTLSFEQKFSRGVLAEKLRDNKAAELSAQEISVIDRLLAKLAGPGLLTQAVHLLDPNAKTAPLN